MKIKIPLIFVTTFSLSSYADTWVDDWFDNSISTSPSSYNNQKRGFYSLGGMSGRINTSVDNPINIQLPKLSSGCGGVNLFYGGVSLMDEEFLVQKLENAMQAAPAIAFDMAIKTVTKEFSESLGKFEQITNALNSLQLDDCAIAKSAVTTVVEGRYSDIGSDVWGTITNNQSLSSSNSKSYTESVDKISSGSGQPTEDLSAQWQGCHADFKELFTTQGSVIAKATDKFGMGEYSDVVRGYVGDINIHISNAGKIPVGQEVLPCDGNSDASISDFVYGSSQSKGVDGVCGRYLSNGVKDIVESNLNKIATAIRNRQVMDSETEEWINKSPLPVYRIIYRASVDGTVEETINETSELLSYAYAQMMFDDLYRNTRSLFLKMSKVFEESGQGANLNQSCNKSLFVRVTPLLPRLEERLGRVRQQMRNGYVARLEEYQRMAGFVDRQERIDKERLKKSSQETLGISRGNQQ